MNQPYYCTFLADDGVLLYELPLDEFSWDAETNELVCQFTDIKHHQMLQLDRIAERTFLMALDDPPERVLFDCQPATLRRQDPGHKDKKTQEQLYNFRFVTICRVTHSDDPGFNRRFDVESRYARA
jgi:hypothetical protein